MKILAIQPVLGGIGFSPFYGGKLLTCYRLAVHCLDQGVGYYIHPLPKGHQYECFLQQTLFAMGTSGNYATVLPNHQLTGGRLKVAIEATLASAMAECAPDIVHSHHTHVQRLAKAVKQSCKRAPTILTYYSPNILRDKMRITIPYYNHTVFLSELQRRDILGNDYDKYKSRSSVISPDVDPCFTATDSFGRADPRPAVLWVGTMQGQTATRKGLDILLRAWAKSSELRKARLVIAGGGKERPKYEALAKKLKVPADFTGTQTQEQLVELMDASDLMVMPSRGEGLAYVYLEAACRGLPFIGYPRCVEDVNGATGVELCTPFDADKGDSSALATIIERNLMVPGYSRTALDEFKGRARELYRPGSTSESYLELYKHLSDKQIKPIK